MNSTYLSLSLGQKEYVCIIAQYSTKTKGLWSSYPGLSAYLIERMKLFCDLKSGNLNAVEIYESGCPAGAPNDA